ncbi:MAG: division/cell wall cluster transcriptional repressor MraZ [Prevotella sp.]|nr:division/cell wall cluster transcriptional repressor MraZ [Prevotella sp.]
MRFLGNIEAKTDVKGRAFLPAVFRKVLQASGEESLVLRKDAFQSCLVLYPQSVWNEQMDILRGRLNRWNAHQQLIFRQFVADVELTQLDGNGRLLIPKRYMKMANIEQNIKFIGMGDTIEIWSTEATSQPFMEPDEFSRALEAIMATPEPTYPAETTD